MSMTRSMLKKVIVGLTILGITVACATGQMKQSGKPVPVDVIAQLVKFSGKATDPKDVGAIATITFDGQIQFLFPEGSKVSPAMLPAKTEMLNSLDAIGVASTTNSPPASSFRSAANCTRSVRREAPRRNRGETPEDSIRT